MSKIQDEKKKPDKNAEHLDGEDELTFNKITPKFRLWLELKDKSILGKGSALLLENIAKTGSISDAIHKVPSKHGDKGKKTGLSYRFAWGLLKKINERLKKPIIRKFRGGRKGGGTELTETGQELLHYYERLEKLIHATLTDKQLWKALGYKVSDKNRLKGKVVSIMKDNIAAKVKIKLKVPTTIDALITTEAVNALNIKKGDMVKAVIKSTEVMVAKE